MRALALVACVALFSCEESSPKPEDPIWGKQACAHCSMLVSEKPPAAQVLPVKGTRKFFDDVGCMVAWEDREAPQLKARWVRNPVGDGWVDATTAHYLGGQITPMDFGFLPAEEGISFEEMKTAVRAKAARR